MRRSRVQLLVLAFLLHAPALAAGPFANVFLETERVVVRFERGGAGPVVLRDWEGKELQRRDAASVDFGLLPPGYYEAVRGERTLPLVVLIAPEKRVAGETRLSADAAMFLLVARRQLDDMARLLRLCGVQWVRERLVWEDLEPRAKQYRWGALDAVTAALAKQGIRIAESAEAIPAWMRADGDRKAVPDDLRHVYRFAQMLARRYAGRVQAWELWNEPDIAHFFQHPASEISAFQKAGYLGFRRGAAAPIVLGPSLAQRPAAFANHLLAEGTGHYLDVWHYHLYTDPAQYASRAEEHRELLERHAVAAPQWVTEAGIRLQGADGVLDAEARARQAAFIGRSYAEALQAGIERPFWFVFPFYREKETGFGLFEPDQRAPFPGVAALSTATYALGRGDPLGKVATDDPAVTALAFDRGNGTAAIVVWRDGEPTDVRLPFDILEIRTHLGTPITSLRAGRAPVYAIVANTMPPSPPRDSATRPSPPELFDVVVRLRSRSSVVDKRIDAYVVPASQKVTLEAQLYNFGPTEFRGQLQLASPSNWSAPPLDRTVTVPPGGRSVVLLSVIAPDHYSRDSFTLLARSGDRKSTPSILWLHVDPRSIKPKRTLDLELDSPAGWLNNVSANGALHSAAGPEGGVRFEVRFREPGDNWAYPERRLDPPLDFSEFNALQFEYRTTIDHADVVRLVLGDATGASFTAPGFPATRAWQTATVLFEDLFPFEKLAPASRLDLTRIARLLIGINATTPSAAVEIRNIRAVRL